MDADKKIIELFVDLPEPRPYSEALCAASQVQKSVIIAGQFPWSEGRLAFPGRLGLEVTLDNGKMAARMALLHALAELRAHLGGSLNTVKKIALLRGAIAAGGEFKDHLTVLDGASQLLHDIFGRKGIHARSAIGVVGLPHGSCVEIELVVELV